MRLICDFPASEQEEQNDDQILSMLFKMTEMALLQRLLQRAERKPTKAISVSLHITFNMMITFPCRSGLLLKWLFAFLIIAHTADQIISVAVLKAKIGNKDAFISVFKNVDCRTWAKANHLKVTCACYSVRTEILGIYLASCFYGTKITTGAN